MKGKCRNPGRGCGSKKSDSFYLEGPSEKKGEGSLWAMSMLFGDGFENVIPITLPPRQMTIVNPAATILTGELILGDFEFVVGSDFDQAAYQDLLTRTKHVGVGDHVGKNNYSVMSFAKECGKYGPSRKISKQTAQRVGPIIFENGAIPMLFTHDRIPVFNNQSHLLEAIQVVSACWEDEPKEIDWGDYCHAACWQYHNWGQYSVEGQWNGWENPPHFFFEVMHVVDQLDKHWKFRKDQPAWAAAKEFFKWVTFIEQPIGLSWLTRVTYTLPEKNKGKYEDKARDMIPGVDILDLDALDEDGFEILPDTIIEEGE